MKSHQKTTQIKTYTLKTMQESQESNVIDYETGLYNRSTSSDLKRLVKLISGYYNNNRTLITTSGIHAISTTLLAICSKYDYNLNIVYGNEMYCDTHRLLQEYLPEMYNSKINLFSFTPNDTDYLTQIFEDNLKGKINVLFVESCSNPNGKIMDFRIIPYLRALSKELIVIVDNTWTTHEIFKPFDYDVDITVISMTKYYSGGTMISGASMFAEKVKDIYEIAYNRNKIEGIHISPSIAVHLCNTIPEMKNRIERSSDMTVRLIDELIKYYGNTIKEKINHPYLHQNIFFKKDLYPSVFTINFNCSLKYMYEAVGVQQVIPLITSFGAHNTRIDPYSYEYVLSDGITRKCALRIAVGYDDENNFEEILYAIKLVIGQIPMQHIA